MEFDRAGFDREVAKRLQLHRKNKGITQDGLAQRIGMSRPTYANIEAGRQRIALDVVWRAAIVLGVSITALVPEPLHRSSPPSVLQQQPPASFAASYVSLPVTAASSVTLPSYSVKPADVFPVNVRPIRKIPDPTTG